MNISYQWLRDLVDTALRPNELAERLTMLGLAVEGIEEVGDDFVLDIDLTSNRPDCLSHLGVAREIAAMEGGETRLAESELASVSGRSEDLTSVEIDAADLCPRYAAHVIRGVKIQPSPEWLAQRLKAIGQRPINNVADITNYVLHEMGQPLHAFDMEKLREQRIVVRRAHTGEKLTTLDGIERELDAEMLVIGDAERAVALAGIMGGEESEISGETTDVLIESAYFKPGSVRRTARILGMRTEASHRFERGVDYNNVLRAQQRCVSLICEIAGGVATENAIDVYPRPLRQPLVTMRPERVKLLTGLNVSSAEIERILTGLGFSECARNLSAEEEWTLRDGVIEELPDQLHSKLTFAVPTWRVDVTIEEDLVEEVARHTGYDRIESKLPASSVAGEYQPNERRKRELCRALTASGYDEAISFSFVDATNDGRIEVIPRFAGITQDTDQFVTLRNPIIEGETRMRPTLLVGLLGAVRHNLNHGTRDIRLFEIGRIFATAPGPEELPLERESLALVATGRAREEQREGDLRELDFLDIKGALEACVDSMNLPALSFKPFDACHLRRGQSATISLSGGGSIGYIGRLDDVVAAEYKFRQPVYLAEVDLTELLAETEAPVVYKSLARFPSVGRDVSFLVARATTFADLREAVLNEKHALCRAAKLVGVFEGANVPDDKRSVTIRLEYRADDRTLRDDEVDEIHQQIVFALERKFDAHLRI
jgi:phenylalanyl-tRNA synthetase beta chain